MKHYIGAALFAASIAGASVAGTITDTYTSYYAFGDSLTDDGKFGLLSNPSVGGSFSNDLVYAERIAAQFDGAGLDTGNLALGGATAGNVNLNPAGPLSTFAGQVGVFANSLLNNVGLPTGVLPVPTASATPPTPGTNPLVSVLFGANDIFQGFNPIDAANSVGDGIRAIAALGAEFDDFLVLTLPDLGLTPAYAGANSAGGTFVSNLFNTQLMANILDLRDDGLNIDIFDTGAAFQDLLDDVANGGQTYGILDATNPCTARLEIALQPNFVQPPSCLDFGIDPNTLLFADGVHPNGVVHSVIADRIQEQLAPVPLPASLPLMVMGLFGVRFITRRRRHAA
ncbi:hypothetical protein C1J03_02110 [Sulfitobacter sp. SK012]|uniref:SGNH/GDSL hydrolase family protein n=1 Tax=Sulfitobacter sp. SK012 TaxID=1389005 RepID=UPI000E0A6D65|nr:SGNH/GDSL hydrolase family protein [Sulfitobacter sp. SK012]AXI44933.1 hypothetical protein C1J03_02110 [Sulfitobacter sp. SK012]